MSKLRCQWIRRGWGLKLGAKKEDRLLNLRFADDVLLVASSAHVLKKMMQEMCDEVAKVGLKIHTGKTKILANAFGRKQSRAENIELGMDKIEILPAHDSTKYLGREFSLDDYHDREIRHRMSCGWAKFSKQRHTLRQTVSFEAATPTI